MKTETKITKKIKKLDLLMMVFLTTILLIGVVTAGNFLIWGGEWINDKFWAKDIERTLNFATVTYAKENDTLNSLSDMGVTQEYKYNEQVPEEVILEEMRTLAERFNINADKWEKLLRCEATCVKDYCVKGELDNLARNNKSTAVGLGQYLINTWYATESWKQHRKARTDYKASLWEMGLDLSTGQQNKWQECLDITGIYNFVK